MSRLPASATFLKDDKQLLWIGLLQRDTGRPAAEWLGIKDEVTALEFSLAVSLRLLRFDNEKDLANKKFWVTMLGGEANDKPDLPSFIANDPYADESTIIN